MLQCTTITKEGEFLDIRADVEAQLKSKGYSKVLYSDPHQGFVVTVKNAPLAKSMLIGEPHPYKLILKYTKAGEGKTRIDMVNGSSSLVTRGKLNKILLKLVKA